MLTYFIWMLSLIANSPGSLDSDSTDELFEGVRTRIPTGVRNQIYEDYFGIRVRR